MNLIAAMGLNRVIGKDGKLPWHIPEDMEHFKNMTMGCAVIMGRRTYESLGGPLRGRANIVMSRSLTHTPPGFTIARDMSDALMLSEGMETFVIGGAEVYMQLAPFCSKLFITEVQRSFNGDTYFPQMPRLWKEVSREQHFTSKGLEFHFVEYAYSPEISREL